MKPEHAEKLLSSEAQKVWETLSKKQRTLSKKDCPFKLERNNLIFDLRSRGVMPGVLAEISGLSRQAIFNIVKVRGGVSSNELAIVKQDVKQIQKSVGVLGHHISKIEKRQ